MRQADALEEMLRAIATGFRTEDRDLGKRIARLNEVVDRLNRAVQVYLGRAAPRPARRRRSTRRVAEIRAFVLHLESAGDVLDRSLSRVAAKWARDGVRLDDGMMEAIQAMHARGLEQLQLAIAAFMREDVAAARRLIEEKERMRVEEAEVGTVASRWRRNPAPSRRRPCCWRWCATSSASVGIWRRPRIRCWSASARCVRAG